MTSLAEVQVTESASACLQPDPSLEICVIVETKEVILIERETDSFFMFSTVNLLALKMAYHEKLTFSVFKCYNGVPGASTNPENVKKKAYFFGKPFSASLWKNELLRFCSPHDVEGILL